MIHKCLSGKFVPPIDGLYFDNISPIDGKVFIKAARSNAKDIDAAADAARHAFDNVWSKTSPTERSRMLLKIADIVEANLEYLAVIETIDNGIILNSSWNYFTKFCRKTYSRDSCCRLTPSHRSLPIFCWRD